MPPPKPRPLQASRTCVQRGHMSKAPSGKRGLTDGQRAYEARRAAKAGLSLDKWLAAKEREAADAARAEEKARKAGEVKPAKPPGLLRRLLDRAHRPL